MARRKLGFLPTLSWGVMMVLTGSVMFGGFGGLSTFECTRQKPSPVQGECKLSSTSLPDSSQTIALASLKGAYIEEDSSSRLSRVVFQTTEGPLLLHEAYTSGWLGSQQRIVNEIQAFLDDTTQEAVSVRQDGRLGWSIIGGLFVLAGCSLVIRSPKGVWIEDPKH